MAAAHPDSIAADIQRDTSEEQSKFRSSNTFTGTVSGRLCLKIINDLGVEKIIYPTGIKVKLFEDDFSNLTLNDAIENTMLEMYNDTVNGYLDASDMFAQILSYNYQNIDSVVQEFLDLAYFKMLESVGSALLAGQAEIDSNNNYPAEFQSVLNVTTALGDSITITDTATYLRKFMYTYDLASLWRIFRHYDSTVSQVSDLMTWVCTEEYDQAAHLLCLANIEKEIQDSNYGVKQIDSLLNNICPYNYFPEETVPFIVLSKKDDEEYHFSIKYKPFVLNNPVKDELNLSYPLKTGETAIIRIYDNQGKLIAYQTSKESSLSMNVEKFKKGIYLIDVSPILVSLRGSL